MCVRFAFESQMESLLCQFSKRRTDTAKNVNYEKEIGATD